MKKETEKIFAAINSSKKKLEIYPGAGHMPLLVADALKWDETVKEFLEDN